MSSSKPCAASQMMKIAAASLLCFSSASCGSAGLGPRGDMSSRSGNDSRIAWINSIDPRTFDAPAGRNAYGAPNATVAIPMTFPILGKGFGFADEFGAPRDGHRHIGQDLFAPKLTPLVAVFDGVVYPWSRGEIAPSNTLTLIGDNGYTAKYLHLNNDTPGTNDGLGTTEYAFAPGLQSGQRVRAGQFLGWVGNSGNAETTPPHCHFELWGPENLPTNPTASLRKAARPKTATTEIPLSNWRPSAGEIRWDGLIRGIDPARSVLTLNLLATTRNNATAAATRPGLTYIKVALTAAIRPNGDGDPVRFSALRPGDRIALRGSAPKRNQPLIARAAALTGWTDAPPFASPAETVTADKPRRENLTGVGNKISDWWNGVKRRNGL